MKRNFAAEDWIDRDRLRELSVREDAPGWRRLLAQLALYLGSLVGILLAEEPWLLWSCVALSALVQFGFFGMLHESCHQTAFKTRGLNLLAGWIAALGQPMTPALMRAFHFEHHRHTHELERDPELAGFEWMLGWPRHVMWLGMLSGTPLVMARVGWTLFAAVNPPWVLWPKVLPFVKPDKRRRIVWEARGLVLVHGVLIYLAVAHLPRLGLLYAALWIGHGLLGAYITCEHRGLPSGGSILERTRSLQVPGWLRWLLWNMPYHAEHHAWPAVPFFNLGKVHQAVKPHLVHVVSPLYLHLHRGAAPKAIPGSERQSTSRVANEVSRVLREDRNSGTSDEVAGP